MPRLVSPYLPAGSFGGGDQPTLAVPGNLVLRPWRVTDADAVAAAFADPVIQRWHVQSIESHDEAVEWIVQWAPRWAAETDACWAVAEATGGVVGRVALRNIDLTAGDAEIAYWILPAARGRGVAGRATAELTRWALDEMALHRLELRHSVHNRPSCRVAGKAGYRLEGVLRSAMLHQDGWHDVHLHARLA